MSRMADVEPMLVHFLCPGPSVSRQSAAATTGNTLWDRLHRSWGSKSPAARLDSVVTRNYPGRVGTARSAANLRVIHGDQAGLV
jgi:hypothetical protein